MNNQNGLAIRLEHISVRHGFELVLNDIDLTIAAGELVCVVGLSGCGKSTLLKCMSALIEVSGGQVTIGDTNITALHERERGAIRARMGFVFQYAALFDSMNVFENVVFGLRKGPLKRRYRKASQADIGTRVTELLADVGLVGVETRLPSELSGGMQRRVGLARALATEPDVILYDEPTSGLDPVTAAAIDQLILDTRSKRRVTSVVVTHDMTSVMRIADRVVMLYGGRVHFDGTRNEFRDSADAVVSQFMNGVVEGPIRTRMQAGGLQVNAR